MPTSLSFAQLSRQQEWIATVARGVHSPADMNVSVPIHISGILDLISLEQAIRETIRSHEPLRTLIAKSEHGLVRQVLPYQMSAMEICISKIRTLDDLANAQRCIFDLSRQIPIRFFLLRITDRHHILLIVYHRIVLDLWSIKPLIKYIFGSYSAIVKDNYPRADEFFTQQEAAAPTAYESNAHRIAPVGESTPHQQQNYQTFQETNSIAAPSVTQSIGLRFNSFIHKRLMELSIRCNAQLLDILHASVAFSIPESDYETHIRLVSEEPGRTTKRPGAPIGIFSSIFEVDVDISTGRTFLNVVSSVVAGRSKGNVQGGKDALYLSGLLQGVRQEDNAWHGTPVAVVVRSHRESIKMRAANCELSSKTPHAPLAPFNICFDLTETYGREGSPHGIDGRISYNATTIRRKAVDSLIERFARTVQWAVSHPDASLEETRGAHPYSSDISLQGIGGAAGRRRGGAMITGNRPERAALNHERLRFRLATNPTQHIVEMVWQEILNVEHISMRDDFFNLGGNPKLLQEMVQRIYLECGVVLKEVIRYEHLTIDDVVDELIHHAGKELCRAVIAEKDESYRPLFFLHGDIDGGGYYTLKMARRLAPEQPLYMLNPHGLDGTELPASVEEMAQSYLKYILERQQRGPYYLVGYCNAGLAAYEIAQRLTRLGHQVGMVGLIYTQFNPSPDAMASGGQGNNLGSQSKRYFHVASKYIPTRYDGKVYVYQGQRPEGVGAVSEQWAKVAGNVKIFEVKGSHRSCVTVHLDDLADRIRDSLTLAQSLEES